MSDPLMSRPLEFIGRGGGASSAPLLPAPTPLPAIPKAPSQDKNWMFDSNGKIDQDAALKHILKIRDYNPDVWQKKQQSQFDEFFGAPGGDTSLTNGPSALENRMNRGETDPANSLRSAYEMRRDRGDQFEPDRPNPELDFRRLLDATTPSLDPLLKMPEDSFRESFGNLTATDSLTLFGSNREPKSTRETESRSEFQKLIGPVPIIATSISELIDSTPDTTRESINPIIGRQPSGRSDLSDPRGLSEPFGNVGSRSSLSTTLESFNTRSAPSRMAPPAPLPVAPNPFLNPARFEPPRRKF